MVKPFYIIVSPVASKFAKALQQALQDKVINSVYRREWPKITRKKNVLPFFNVTQRPFNKIEQLDKFTANGVMCPRYATSIAGAKEIPCKTLFARTLVNSTHGRGIIEFRRDSEVYPRAPLYTEYIPKKAEYRFHVFAGQVIDVQQKKKKAGANANSHIRNLDNGYVYCRNDIAPPDGASDLAVRATQALSYQYGAVDLVYNEKRNQCYVLEVNSRPGLMGTALDKYTEALINMFNLTRK